ncbi:MAG TPA: hypothetical protein VH115_08020, partial [Solirubrobacteraceae bacterium]|nr:hypothetical protein [Solirubrobacteraceae bacterium]
ADVEYWFGHGSGFAAQAAAYEPSTVVPANGMVTAIAVKGYAISGDRPGPGGSEPIRFTVAEPQPGGQLKVVTTTNPPFTLPGAPGGVTTFPMSQVSFKCCRVKAGDIVSLDARGGEFAVFGRAPGAVTETFTSGGLSQNEGVLWTGTPHQGVELLMRVTEQPEE